MNEHISPAPQTSPDASAAQDELLDVAVVSHDEDPVERLERLLEIARLDLQSPELREQLDGFAAEAASVLGVPVGLITIVMDTAQLFAGSYGLSGWLAEVPGTPVEWSFCANAVRTGEPYLVSDAAVDVLQYDNPLVTEDGVRSYAGAPLLAENGEVLGACCGVGFEPQQFTPVQVEALEALAARVSAVLATVHVPGLDSSLADRA